MEEEVKKIETKELIKKVCEETEKLIDLIVEDGLQLDNVKVLGELVDIHKDLANEKYWKVKEEKYMREYSRGRYSEYGRRGVRGSGRGRYRGYGNDPEEMMEEMMEHYGNYSEASEEYNEGNYGAEGGMVKSAEGIMKNAYGIIEQLKETDSPEVMQVIKKYAKKINEM